MGEAALNTLEVDKLNSILDRIGYKLKKNITKKALINQVFSALNNNAIAMDLESIEQDSPIDDSYFETSDLIKQLRECKVAEKHITTILMGDITTIEELASEILNFDLPTSTRNSIDRMCQSWVKDNATNIVYPEINENAHESTSTPKSTDQVQQQPKSLPNQAQQQPGKSTIQHQTLFELPNAQSLPSLLQLVNALNQNNGNDDLKWSHFAPTELREDQDIFEWLDTLEWKLKKVDPSGSSWVNKTEQLITGDAQRASDIVREKGYTGQRYLDELRQLMFTGARRNNCWLKLRELRFNIGDDVHSFYKKFSKLAKAINPRISDLSMSMLILKALPNDLDLKVVNDDGLDNIDRLLRSLDTRASMMSIKKSKVMQHKQQPNLGRSPSTSGENMNRANSNNNNLNRNRRDRLNYSNRSNAQNIPNNQSLSRTLPRNSQQNSNSNNYNSSYRNNNNNNPNYRKNRQQSNYPNQKNMRGQNRNNSTQPLNVPLQPLPGTANSMIPSTPQLNAGFISNVQPSLTNSSNSDQGTPIATASNGEIVNNSIVENTWIQQAQTSFVNHNVNPITNRSVRITAGNNVSAGPSTARNNASAASFPLNSSFIAHSNLDQTYPQYFYNPINISDSNQHQSLLTSDQFDPLQANITKRADYISTLLHTCLTRPNLSNKAAIQATFSELSRGKRDPIPELVLVFSQFKSVQLKGLLDSGSPISILPGHVADTLKLMTMPCVMHISGVNGRKYSTAARGLTWLKIQTGPDSTIVHQPFYILDCVEDPIILGRDFIRWSKLNIQSDQDGFTIRRYTGPILDPLKIEKKLLVSVSIPTSQEFASAASRHSQINVGPPTQASDTQPAAYVHRINVDPISDDKPNFEQVIASRIDNKLDHNSRQLIWSVIAKNIDRFSRHKYDLGKVHHSVCNIRINVPNSQVPRCNPFRYSVERAKILDKLVNELVVAGIVEPSKAPGAAPAMLVAKKCGSMRMVASFVELNKLIERRCYPMPNIEDFISQVQGYNYFCSLDLSQGFYQIEVPPEEREKLAFVTQSGKWQYAMLPMGLTDSPAIFQQLMDTVFGDLRGRIVLVYMDDILVMGKTVQQLAYNLDIVFDRLRRYNLKLKGEKCNFGLRELVFLGHLINGDTVKPDPSKIRMLLNQSLPKTMKQLQSFLGFVNHYSRYIPNYSTIAAPLYRLTTKARKFKLEKSDQQIISQLKSALARDCMLAIFNPNAPIRLLVDASNIAVAGILEQQEKGNWRAISYFGQKLTSFQKNYTTQEKECLAVYLCVKKYRHYLEGKSFIICSDHHALCSLPKRTFRQDRICRWQTELSQFDYKITYSKGSYHPADCFTRSDEWKHRTTIEVDEDDDSCLFTRINNVDAVLPNSRLINANYYVNNVINEFKRKQIDLTTVDDSYRHNQILKIVTDIPFDRNTIRISQEKDSFCKSVITDLRTKVKSDFLKKFEFVEGILYRLPVNSRRISRIVLPLSAKDTIIDFYHSGDAGSHFGASKTYELISRFFWCKDLLEWVRARVYECDSCNSNKKEQTVGNIPNEMPIAENPMDRLQIDVVGSFPTSRSGNEFIITVIDMHSGYAWAKACKRTTAADLIKFMRVITLEKGLPSILHSDNGRNFVSQQFRRYLEINGIKHVRSTYYHPQSQGRVERLNGIINDRLRTSAKSKETWDEDLAELIFKLNSQPLSANRPSPFYLMNGFEPRTISNNLLNINPPKRENIEIERKIATEIRSLNQKKSLQRRSKSFVPPRITFGDIVRIKIMSNDRNKGKLANKFSANRYIVIRVNPNSTARIVDLKSYQERTENLSRLKRDRGRKPGNYDALIDRYKASISSSTTSQSPPNNVNYQQHKEESRNLNSDASDVSDVNDH